VIGMIVGLTELSFGVNEELEDLGSAIGSINQTYYYTLASGHKGEVVGSTFLDFADECDGQKDRVLPASLHERFSGDGYRGWFHLFGGRPWLDDSVATFPVRWHVGEIALRAGVGIGRSGPVSRISFGGWL
jgi:hypothetical protein